MHELQAAAAVGQMGLVQAYESCFRDHGIATAQVLLTHADLADRGRYLNARSTLRTLLALGVVPVINENDTVVTDEIRVGDNDTLAALVANLIEADVLVILTDQAGLFTADPRRDRRRRCSARPRGRSRARGDGRRCGQHARSRRHAHQGAGGKAGRAQRRAHGDRIGRRSPTCCSASLRARRSARCSADTAPLARPQAVARGSRAGRRSADLDAGACTRSPPAARACCRSA